MVVSKANRNVVEAMTGNRRHRRIVSPALIIMDGSIAIAVVSGLTLFTHCKKPLLVRLHPHNANKKQVVSLPSSTSH